MYPNVVRCVLGIEMSEDVPQDNVFATFERQTWSVGVCT